MDNQDACFCEPVPPNPVALLDFAMQLTGIYLLATCAQVILDVLHRCG